MYSAPSAPGVLYWTHSPLRVMTAWPARTSSEPPGCVTCSRPLQDVRVLVELRRLSGFNPARRTAHVRDADRAGARVHASDDFVDEFRFVARCGDAGWLFDKGRHHVLHGRLPQGAGPSDNSLIEHGLGDFAEAGDVGAINVVDKPLVLTVADALVVDGFHDVAETLVHFFA